MRAKMLLTGGLTASMMLASANAHAFLYSDDDNDGLIDILELMLYGTDPTKADSDNDGLKDGDEVLVHQTDPNDNDSDDDLLVDYWEVVPLGSDPNLWDTDGDGYGDGEELIGGSDMLDANDVIYQGGWPFYPQKWLLFDSPFSQAAVVGAPAPRFEGEDQFGDQVELFDFAYEGAPVVVDISASWCGPCKDLASFMAHQIELPSGLSYYTHAELVSLRNKVDSGAIHWVTVLIDGGSPADWDAAYPNEHIPVLADAGNELYDIIFGFQYPRSIPSLSVVSEDMVWQGVHDPAAIKALAAQ